MEQTISEATNQGNSIADAAVEAATQTFGNQLTGLWLWVKGHFTGGNLFKILGAAFVILLIFFI